MDRLRLPFEQIAEIQNEILECDTKQLWVFAYGSLCWKPGFEFKKAVTGYVRGYHRRFWQGNTTHRGTEDKPGRVATLIEDSEGLVHGMAFAISGEAAVSYLSKRECELGGYISKFMEFHPVVGQPFKVLVYVATPTNRLWLGEAELENIAEQIVDCSGPSGHNVEYLIRLANFMREHFANHDDTHLFGLENKVLSLIDTKKMCLTTLMGSGEGCVSFIRISNSRESSPGRRREQGERVESFEHTARVPGTKLRCLNI